MSVVTREVWKCDRPGCGHEWFKPGEAPKSCARCKVKGWNTGPSGPIAQAVMKAHGVNVRTGKMGNGRERGKAIARKRAVGRSRKEKSKGMEDVPRGTVDVVGKGSLTVGVGGEAARMGGLASLAGVGRGGHDPAGCRIYRCGTCAVLKGGGK